MGADAGEAAFTGMGAGVGELQRLCTSVQAIDVSDDEVPAYLKMPQIDLLVIHSPKDAPDVEKFINNICSEEDIITGDLFATFFANDDDGVIQVSSWRQDAIAKNIQRATYVAMYVTKTFCMDAEVKAAYFHALQESLRDKTRHQCVIPVWAEPRSELEEHVEESLEDVKGLTSLFVMNGVANDKEGLSKVRKLLKRRDVQRKKTERERDQSWKRDQWKIEQITRKLQREVRKVNQLTQAHAQKATAVKQLSSIHASGIATNALSSTGPPLVTNPISSAEPSGAGPTDHPKSWFNPPDVTTGLSAKAPDCDPPPYYSLKAPSLDGQVIPVKPALERTTQVPRKGDGMRGAGVKTWPREMRFPNTQEVQINIQENHYHNVAPQWDTGHPSQFGQQAADQFQNQQPGNPQHGAVLPDDQPQPQQLSGEQQQCLVPEIQSKRNPPLQQVRSASPPQVTKMLRGLPMHTSPQVSSSSLQLYASAEQPAYSSPTPCTKQTLPEQDQTSSHPHGSSLLEASAFFSEPVE